MPCRSDYMEPTAAEIETGRVMMLINEVKGLAFDHKLAGQQGYGLGNHLHTKTADLCRFLSETDADGKLVHDPKNYSLELQIWWRDHQEADRKRAERKAKELSEEDRKLLQNIRTWAKAQGVEVEADDAALIARLKRLMPQIYAARGEE